MKKSFTLILLLIALPMIALPFILPGFTRRAASESAASVSPTVAPAAVPTTVPTAVPTAEPTPEPTPTPAPPIPEDHVIYLTFDDGPSEYTEALLDVLDRYNVKATFFVIDTGHYDILAEEHRRGHSIGIHSATHKYDEIYASKTAYFDDLQKMSDIVYEHTGVTPTLIRFPGGSSNTISSFNPGIMSALAEDVTAMGYQYFDWNVLSGDAGETQDTEEIAQNVINGVQQNRISVVLQHDSKKYSIDAVEKIITWGLENGYTFLPLTADTPPVHHVIAN